MGVVNKRRAGPDYFDDLLWEGDCERCGGRIGCYRGDDDLQCQCGAIYNCFGQRLRDDLYEHPNPSEWNEDIGDLEGYEIAMLRAERGDE